MKQKLLYVLALVMMVMASSCEDPQYVAPTANRQGITSISALFPTTGSVYDGQELAKLDLGDVTELPERLVIPVPYFFPKTSDNETDKYMNNVRVQVELAPNCFIEPKITVLDLTKENEFTFTDPQGNSKKIIITGERVKSSDCELNAFSILEPEITGIIDKTAQTVSLISSDDLSAALASYDVSAHAYMVPDPSKEVLNYNEEVKLRVYAHDGVTYKEYKVFKDEPQKMSSGMNALEPLFSIDPVSMLGVSAFDVDAGPTLAYVKGKLVVCDGLGDAPVYANALTGAKLGNINLGSAVAGSVTNDEAEHLIIVNKAQGGEAVSIYTTTSVETAPELFYQFDNPTTLPCGSKIKVMGNLDTEALIVMPCEGVSGVTTSSSVIYITVQGGAVVSCDVADLSAAGLSWDSANVNTAGMAAVSTNFADGLLWSKYGGTFCHVTSAGVFGNFANDTSGWGLNANCIDSKSFNNQRYAALFVVSHFPAWGMGPEIYVYNITDMSKFAGTAAWDLECLIYSETYASWTQSASYSIASGDVVLAPTADGYKFYVFGIDHNSQLLSGYVADCIQR